MEYVWFQAEEDWTGEVLPNDYIRGEYYIQGYSASDIDWKIGFKVKISLVDCFGILM